MIVRTYMKTIQIHQIIYLGKKITLTREP